MEVWKWVYSKDGGKTWTECPFLSSSRECVEQYYVAHSRYTIRRIEESKLTLGNEE